MVVTSVASNISWTWRYLGIANKRHVTEAVLTNMEPELSLGITVSMIETAGLLNRWFRFHSNSIETHAISGGGTALHLELMAMNYPWVTGQICAMYYPFRKV